MSGSDSHYLKLTTVTGYFQQDDPATNPDGFDYVSILIVGNVQLLTSFVVSLEFWLDRPRL